MSRQVVILFAATRKLLSDVPLSHARGICLGLAEYMENIQPQVMEEIQQTGELSAENRTGHPGLFKPTKAGEPHMAGITEIRSRMRSIEQTLKITNAMYLISPKVKKPCKQLSEVQPYFEQIAKTLLDIFRHSPELRHRFVDGHESVKEKKAGFVVITGDKGLAGAYNHNVLKLAESYMARKRIPPFS